MCCFRSRGLWLSVMAAPENQCRAEQVPTTCLALPNSLHWLTLLELSEPSDQEGPRGASSPSLAFMEFWLNHDG